MEQGEDIRPATVPRHQAVTVQRHQDDLTQIDLELASNCFSEDEEIIEWETLITNGLEEKQK